MLDVGPPRSSARVIAAMVRRAAPRVVTTVLLIATAGVAAATTGVLASASHWVALFGLPLASVGVKQWWRYVKYGKPAPWRVEHDGTTALFVTDPGRARLEVASRLREHGGLEFGEALSRADDPSRPVWDDLTTESAGQIGAILNAAGATVRVGPRPSPSWARDVTGR